MRFLSMLEISAYLYKSPWKVLKSFLISRYWEFPSQDLGRPRSLFRWFLDPGISLFNRTQHNKLGRFVVQGTRAICVDRENARQVSHSDVWGGGIRTPRWSDRENGKVFRRTRHAVSERQLSHRLCELLSALLHIKSIKSLQRYWIIDLSY